jgi:uncharacterized protein YndB with AHSA1/START domain
MTTTIRLAMELDAAPAKVWAAIEDISTHVDWMRDAVDIRFTGDQRVGLGTEFESLTRVGPLQTNDVLRVVEWDPGRVMAIEHRGAVTGTGRFELFPAGRFGERTEFVWTERLTYPWWMGGAAGELASRPILARIWRANLHHLRRIVESP